MREISIINDPVLVLTRCKMDLLNYIRNGNLTVKNLDKIEFWIWELLKTIEYMHHNNIIHRDLKSNNILVTEDERHVIVADFGLSRVYETNKSLSSNRCTYVYSPPEMLLGYHEYDSRVDIWSLGVIILDIFLERYIFAGNGPNQVMKSILSICGCPPLHKWPQLSACTSFNYKFNRLKYGNKGLSIDNYLTKLNNFKINQRRDILNLIKVTLLSFSFSEERIFFL